MNNTKNLMIVGVGGQGSLLASRVIGAAAMKRGYDVKVSEVHGMSQRGGSVVTYVRYGERVDSPVLGKGEADVILAFEQLEAARWLSYLKPGGVLISSTQRIKPMPVVTGAAEYPDGILDSLSEKARVIAVDALSLAKQAGNEKTANVVLLGQFARCGDFTKEELNDALLSCLPEKLAGVNQKAFELGYAINEGTTIP